MARCSASGSGSGAARTPGPAAAATSAAGTVVGGAPAAALARARFTARLAPDAAVAAGERVRLRVDMERLHFFDPDTTLALR